MACSPYTANNYVWYDQQVQQPVASPVYVQPASSPATITTVTPANTACMVGGAGAFAGANALNAAGNAIQWIFWIIVIVIVIAIIIAIIAAIANASRQDGGAAQRQQQQQQQHQYYQYACPAPAVKVHTPACGNWEDFCAKAAHKGYYHKAGACKLGSGWY